MSDTSVERSKPWWQNPAFIGALAALAAAILPVTTLVQTAYQSRNQLAVQKAKQTHEIRQTYLAHVLKNDQQTERVLKFLVKVEEDVNLKAWAKAELDTVQTRIKTKSDLYIATVETVSELVNSDNPGDESNIHYKNFWKLYKGPLIPVESQKVAELMVGIGDLIKDCQPESSCNVAELKELGFQLSLQIKRELQSGTPGQ